MKQLLGVIVLGLLVGGCKVTGGDSNPALPTGSGSLYLTDASHQINGNSTQGAAHQLLIGNFSGSGRNDLMVLTDTGVYFYANQGGTTWAPPILINDTVGKRIQAGFAGTTLLTLYFQESQFLTLLGSSQNYSLHSSEGWVGSLQSMVDLGSGLLLATASDSQTVLVHQTNYIFDSITNLTGSLVAPQAGLLALAADLDGNGTKDVILIGPQTNVVQVFKNTADSLTSAGTITRSVSSALYSGVLASVTGGPGPDLILFTASGAELYSNQSSGATISFSGSSVVSLGALSSGRLIAGNFHNTANASDLFVTQNSSPSKFLVETTAQSFQYADSTTTSFGSNVLKSGALQTYAADIDGDGKTDLLELFPNGAVAIHLYRGP